MIGVAEIWEARAGGMRNLYRVIVHFLTDVLFYFFFCKLVTDTSNSSSLRPLFLVVKGTGHRFVERLGGPLSRSGPNSKKKDHCPGRQARFIPVVDVMSRNREVMREQPGEWSGSYWVAVMPL